MAIKDLVMLEEALCLLEPQEHHRETAAFLDSMAEHRLKLGSPDEAHPLHDKAGPLRAETEPGNVYVEARAMVRTGQLTRVRRLLERRAEEKPLPGGVQWGAYEADR